MGPIVTMIVTMTRPAVRKVVGAGEFKAKCLELMDGVSEAGDVIVVTKRGKPVAQLVPVVTTPPTLMGYLAEQIDFVGDVISPVEVPWGPAAHRTKRRSKARRA